jgi:hypothetical protein
MLQNKTGSTMSTGRVYQVEIFTLSTKYVDKTSQYTHLKKDWGFWVLELRLKIKFASRKSRRTLQKSVAKSKNK